MENVIETIKEYLTENGYHLLEDDTEYPNVVRIRYQLKVFHIIYEEGEEPFFSVLYQGVAEMDDDNRQEMMYACCEFSKRQRVIRAYPLSNDDIAISYEFFTRNEEEIFYQLKMGIETVSVGARLFRRITWKA